MTREKLNSYRSTVRLIEKDRRRLRSLENNKPSAVFGKAKGSSKSFPFTERSFSVCGAYEQSGMSEKEYHDRIQNLKYKIQSSIENSLKDKLDVEEFIESIENKTDKLIFIGLFYEGRTQEDIARELGCMDRSTVSRIVSKYIV